MQQSPSGSICSARFDVLNKGLEEDFRLGAETYALQLNETCGKLFWLLRRRAENRRIELPKALKPKHCCNVGYLNKAPLGHIDPGESSKSVVE
jgi:hypothetical protein